MARRWYNEDFRKLYTRQDGPWLALPFCARGLAADLLRYADDRGVVAIVGEGEEEGDAIAAVVRAKFDERETMIRAVKALRAEGYLARKGDRLLIKNFVAAQQRLSQEAARAQRARDKKATDGVTVEGVTEGGRGRDVGRDESVTSDPPNVTQKFAVSRRDETRREEPPPARAVRDPSTSTTDTAPDRWTPLDFETAWWEIVGGAPTGNPMKREEAIRLATDTAAHENADPAKVGRELLSEFVVLVDHWATTGQKIAPAKSVEKFIEHFAKVAEQRKGGSGSNGVKGQHPEIARLVRETRGM